MAENKNPLRTISRHITTHDSEGKSVFSDAVPSETPIVSDGSTFGMAMAYIADGFPLNLDKDGDIDSYKSYLQDPPGIMHQGGSIVHTVDFPPKVPVPMHRTMTVDIGVCVEGEMDAVMDSGETRRMKRGDFVIQRGTNHTWRNPSETEWCRMVFILLTCKPPTVNGKELETDLSGFAPQEEES